MRTHVKDTGEGRPWRGDKRPCAGYAVIVRKAMRITFEVSWSLVALALQVEGSGHGSVAGRMRTDFGA